MNDKILDEILIKQFGEIIKNLPRNKKDAITTRQLVKKCKIPQTTMYRYIKLLLKWDNIGKIPIKTTMPPEFCFYLKHNFRILFRKGTIKLVLEKEK